MTRYQGFNSGWHKLEGQRTSRGKLTPQEVAEVRRDVRAFLARQGWATERQIFAETGWDRDAMRAAEMLEDGTVIGHSSLGFKLTEMASDGEIEHALRALNSRRKELGRRCEAIRAARDAGPRPEPPPPAPPPLPPLRSRLLPREQWRRPD